MCGHSVHWQYYNLECDVVKNLFLKTAVRVPTVNAVNDFINSRVSVKIPKKSTEYITVILGIGTYLVTI